MQQGRMHEIESHEKVGHDAAAVWEKAKIVIQNYFWIMQNVLYRDKKIENPLFSLAEIAFENCMSKLKQIFYISCDFAITYTMTFHNREGESVSVLFIPYIVAVC